MNNFKMILFDIDNTLVYGRKAAAFYRQYSRTLEKALAVSLSIDLTEAVAIANDHRAKYNGRGELAFQTYGLSLEAWHDAVCSLDPAAHLEPMPSTNQVLKYLKKKKIVLGAITDGPRPQVERIFKAANINVDNFAFVIGWERGQTMPKYGSSAIYKKVCKENGIEPEQTVMIGDSLSSDVLPALAAGLKAIHVAKEKNQKTDRYQTIKSIEELTSIL